MTKKKVTKPAMRTIIIGVTVEDGGSVYLVGSSEKYANAIEDIKGDLDSIGGDLSQIQWFSFQLPSPKKTLVPLNIKELK